jgi:hypothetical protein
MQRTTIDSSAVSGDVRVDWSGSVDFTALVTRDLLDEARDGASVDMQSGNGISLPLRTRRE